MPSDRPSASRYLPLLALAMLARPISAEGSGPILADDIRPHIRTLASDAFEGRASSGPGQERSIHYIARQLRNAGLQPGGPAGTWFQPVEIEHLVPEQADLSWRVGQKWVNVAPEEFALIGPAGRASIRDAPVVFVGYGLEERGYHNLGGMDLRGKVALLLTIPSDRDLDSDSDLTQKKIRDLGAAAVIRIYPKAIPFFGKTIPYPWRNLRAGWLEGSFELRQPARPIISGALPYPTAKMLLQDAGEDLDALITAASQKNFKAVRVGAFFSPEVRTKGTLLRTYNVIGKLRGGTRSQQVIALTAHWDGLGYCRPPGAADRICNGAADNASGVAAMIEIARRMTAQARPDRSVLFIATGGEELGALGSKAFIAHPPISLHRLVAALNLDMLAPARPEQPLGIVGAGKTPIDPLIRRTAQELGRQISTDDKANDYLPFTDTGPFLKAGVPAVSVQSLYGDSETLKAFEANHYHQPSDEYSDALELRGAADDATFNLLLIRRLADRRYFMTGSRRRI